MKILGIKLVASQRAYGIQEAKWKAMQSLLVSAVMAGVIKLDVEERNGETVVFASMPVEDKVSSPPEFETFDSTTWAAMLTQYPFLSVLLSAGDCRIYRK